MKKLLVLPAALLLTSCTVMDVVGPRPNGEIMALAKQASADATGGDPDWRALRQTQSQQLNDEALRLCGVDPSGKTPSSCDVAGGDTELPAAADASALLEHTVAAADKVPSDSVDLVVAQAVDALALTTVDLEPVRGQLTSDADAAAARDMLARENAMYYGLGIALAYADDGLRARIGVLRDASHERVDALTRILPPGVGEALVPAAGYAFADGYAEPTSPEEAAQLVKSMQADLVKEWRYAAARADAAQWREDAIRLAAHAQRV